jgi:glycerol uptake facilitator-like aquaporin
MIGSAFCSAKYSGAHLNPAVTLAMALTGKAWVPVLPR